MSNIIMDATSLSHEFANSVLPVTIIIGILAVFGLFGNASVLYVYKCKYSPCNFRTFVLCLAMIDFTSCLFVFPMEMYGHRIWFSYPKSAAWFCKLKTSMYAVAVFTSSYILLLISIDRFRKVCRPLGWQITQKVAFGLCFFIFGLAMILVIPCPILFGIQTTNITYSGYNVVITSCQKDDLYKDSIWITIYVAAIYYVSVITFMVTTMVLYGMILRKLFCGDFLKEIDHTDELKRRSRMKAEEFSGDEIGVFSSDTFMDLTSTCDDQTNTTNEPQITYIQSTNGIHTNEETKLEAESQKENTKSIIELHTKETETTNMGLNAAHVATDTDLHDAETETPIEMQTESKVNTDETNKENEVKASDIQKDCNETARESDLQTSQIQSTNGLDIKDDEIVAKTEITELQTEPIKAALELHTTHKQNTVHFEVKAAVQGKTTDTVRKRSRHKSKQASSKHRIRGKSLIMFVVTLIFNITTLIYFCIFTIFVRREHIFEVVTTDTAGILFFFWRLYFVNHVINPVVYGFLDPRFRQVIRKSWRRLCRKRKKLTFR